MCEVAEIGVWTSWTLIFILFNKMHEKPVELWLKKPRLDKKQTVFDHVYNGSLIWEQF